MRALSDINKLEFLQAGLPALGGIASARALARFYQIFAQISSMFAFVYTVPPATLCVFSISTSAVGALCGEKGFTPVLITSHVSTPL